MDGYVDIVSGGMFSGKTTELEKRVKVARIAAQTRTDCRVMVFKPTRDTRVERCGESLQAIKVDRPHDILPLAEGVTDLFIDEAHLWFMVDEAEELREVCLVLARRGVRVTVSLLNADYTGRPFPASSLLFAIATHVHMDNAVCATCGRRDASFSHRLTGGTAKVQVGSAEYEPQCVVCFVEPPKTDA